MKKETHTSHEVQIEGGDVAYVKMPQAEHDKKVTKSIMLRELIKEYKGPDIVLDFSEDDELLGVEILAF
jgi:hypothetical protein